MTSALFSPITMRGLTLPNRIVVSPMCQFASENGSATDWHLMHLGHLSLGAAGLVIMEMTNVSPIGRITPKCAGMYSDDNEKALKRVHDFCRSYGVAKLGVQLAHAGRKASMNAPMPGSGPLKLEEGGWTTHAPSAIPFDEKHSTPHAMTRDEIKQTIADFAAGTRRLARIGFDLIELHGAHGYLLHQFMSPLSNQRTDEYGGSLANRMRFVLEVFSAVRNAWPDDKALGIRLSATDWVEGGWTPDDTVALARELKALGCDFIDVSSGGNDPRQKIPMGPGYQVPFSEKVRKEAGIATMSVGMITSARQAEEVIALGKADMVALGRGVMYDPRWAWHAAEELGADTAYAAKMRMAHPSLRPQIFTNRATPAA